MNISEYWATNPSIRSGWHKRKHQGGFVYKITSLDTGRIYIGQSVTPVKRWRQHVKDAVAGADRGFYGDLREYGADRFEMEIIASCLHRSWILGLESELIGQYDADVNGYNTSGPGVMRAWAEMVKAIRSVGTAKVIEALAALSQSIGMADNCAEE